MKLEDGMKCSYKRDQISSHLSAHRLEGGMKLEDGMECSYKCDQISSHLSAHRLEGGMKLEDGMKCSYKRDQISSHLSAHRLEVVCFSRGETMISTFFHKNKQGENIMKRALSTLSN